MRWGAGPGKCGGPLGVRAHQARGTWECSVRHLQLLTSEVTSTDLKGKIQKCSNKKEMVPEGSCPSPQRPREAPSGPSPRQL